MNKLSTGTGSAVEQGCYAHSLAARPRELWQPLEVHCRQVAALAGDFAEAFGSRAWGEVLGWLHDAGKARTAFQRYLARANGLIDEAYDTSEHGHSGVGACWAKAQWKSMGQLLAYCLAGHHAGLPDWSGGETPNGALEARLEQEQAQLAEPEVQAWLAAHAAALQLPRQKPFPLTERNLAFWLRMLYSCLVDADFLDTEGFMDGARAAARGGYQPLSTLAERFFARLAEKERTAADTAVNQVRSEIRAACERAAEAAPGLFSLTVPTGGGKTLSAMAFAFRHAQKYGKRRILYVIPYTSIIEQTADVLRGFLGEESVLEHHSSFDPKRETQQSRLAAENWDAPVVVTTTVQFFESLYACKPSRCRRLHNLAESVVILDEVQLLPMKLLKPCIWAITELATNYGTTFVLSTATQPNLPGLSNVREIISPEMRLYERLKRTQWTFPKTAERQSWEKIAAELTRFEQVLCVVNTRRDCRALYDLMPPGTIHLSASMCGEHRSRVIARIKTALSKGEPIRVISTQLVEAGVDIDFPVVYRAFTGLASIAQSAGRCNREGRLGEPGQVVVFYPPQESPRGELRWAEYATAELLALPERPPLDAPEAFPRYFERLQARAHTLGEAFEEFLVKGAAYARFQFREAAAAFQMIDDSAESVLVRYDRGEKLIEQVQQIGAKRGLMRQLQRFTVSVPRQRLKTLLAEGVVEEVHPGIYAQAPHDTLYSEDFGFDLFRDGLTVEETIMV